MKIKKSAVGKLTSADMQMLRRQGDEYPLGTDDRPYLEFYLLRTIKKGKGKIPCLNFWN